MPKITTPRAFPAFDPALHVQAAEFHTGVNLARITGIDIGVDAPCVALHAIITDNKRISIFAENFAKEMGLSKFIAEGYIGPTSAVSLVVGERAMENRSPLTALSPVQMLGEAGYRPLACKSSPHWRIKKINEALQCGFGAGGIVVDPSCLHLLAALAGHKSVNSGGGKMKSSTPRYQHCVDALGYLVEGAARYHAAAEKDGVGLAFDELA